jgi:hypothetical protein
MKKSIITSVYIFLSLAFVNAFSQTVIESHYGVSSLFSLKGISVCEMQDENYLVLCKGDTSEVYGPGYPVTIEPAYLMKINPQGDSIWTKKVVIDELDLLIGMETTPDGGYVILGQTQQYEIILAKIDADAELIWQKSIDLVGSTEANPRELAITNDGDIIVSGWHVNSQNIANAYLLKTDSDGEQMWFNDSYNLIYDTFNSGVVQDADGNIYFCGFYDPNIGGGAWDHDIYLVKTGPNGDMIWEQVVAHPSEPDYSTDLIITNDNHIAITGKSYVSGYGYITNIVKVDTDGNTVFFNTIYDGEIEGVDIKQAPSGNYFIAGRKDTGGYSYDFNVIKIDPYGNVIWSDYYTWVSTTGIARGEANEIEIIGDDSYMAIGWMIHDEPEIIGGIVSISATHLFIVTPEITTGLERINSVTNVSVFPNPMQNRATITFENPNNLNHTLDVFDMQGSRVINITNITSNQVSIEKNKLPGGMYFYKLIQNANAVATGKIIIE